MEQHTKITSHIKLLLCFDVESLINAFIITNLTREPYMNKTDARRVPEVSKFEM